MSSRHLLMPDLFSAFVNPNRVPQQAQSEVIYLPPVLPGAYAGPLRHEAPQRALLQI